MGPLFLGGMFCSLTVSSLAFGVFVLLFLFLKLISILFSRFPLHVCVGDTRMKLKIKPDNATDCDTSRFVL